MDEFGVKPRLALLLEHFSAVEDDREPWRVAHPLPEILLLVVCATIAACDDFDDIADWGATHLEFLRRFAPFANGVPGARWLNILMNRINPVMFADCFQAWARAAFAGRPAQIALDGKTSRRSGSRAAGHPALHLVSAFATHEKLVLGQIPTAEKSNEITAIPALLEKLAENGGVDGALISIDAIACNPKIAGDILAAKADYLLAVKDNQSALKEEIARFFDEAPETALDRHVECDKGHGRVEERRASVSADIGWMDAGRRFPGEARFQGLALIAMVETKVESKGAVRSERRFYIASRAMDAKALAKAVRDHWRIETSLHWVLDVTFKDDLSRVRTGHGAKNMAVVRHFAFNALKAINDKRSLKLRRKHAGWSPDYLMQMMTAPAR